MTTSEPVQLQSPNAAPQGFRLLPPGEAEPASKLLHRLAAEWTGERISLGELIEVFDDRSYGLLILLLSIPNLIPILIPGWAQIFGVPLLVVTWQMAIGKRRPALPSAIAKRSIRREDLGVFATKAEPLLRRIETFVKPRPGWMTGPGGDRIVGMLGVYVAAMVLLPGPGTNAPPSAGAAVMAIGVLEHDARVVTVGAALTLVGCVVATALVGAFFWVSWTAIGWLL